MDGGVKSVYCSSVVVFTVYCIVSFDGGQDSAREASGKLLASLHISLAQVLLLYWCFCIYCGCSFCREGCLLASSR